ncbi:MAG: hypothetical protein GKR88_01465 [Flavobacteriaceae bacterium]|nr:MAG: hypothetical protein GKR88_01465 [Flavobacteriaceae bacterium]
MTENLNESTLTKGFKEEALKMAVTCVRNTVIESYHEGKIPQSKTGDYSDVKVVTPYGEIAWNEVAKINDMEMKTFNKEVTNRLYTYLEILLGQKYKDEKEVFLNIVIVSFHIIGMSQNWIRE